MDNDIEEVAPTRIERIKEHVKRHQVAYSCGATAVLTGVTVAGITCVIMRGGDTPLATDKSENSVFVRPLSFLSKQEVTTNVVNVLERESRGHPGYITRCKETLEEFASQNKAADREGVSPMIMSLHIRGKIPHINNRHYEHVVAA